MAFIIHRVLQQSQSKLEYFHHPKKSLLAAHPIPPTSALGNH
jgi:hypothetical protein